MVRCETSYGTTKNFLWSVSKLSVERWNRYDSPLRRGILNTLSTMDITAKIMAKKIHI